jgi:hypothetical protein
VWWHWRTPPKPGGIRDVNTVPRGAKQRNCTPSRPRPHPPAPRYALATRLEPTTRPSAHQAPNPRLVGATGHHVPMATELTDIDHQTLQLEQQWWKYAGAKEARILDTFGESATRYYQRLNILLDHPQAEAEYTLRVRRLRRLRKRVRAERCSRRASRRRPATTD